MNNEDNLPILRRDGEPALTFLEHLYRTHRQRFSGIRLSREMPFRSGHVCDLQDVYSLSRSVATGKDGNIPSRYNNVFLA